MLIKRSRVLPLSLIAAIDQNLLMGNAGGIPWKLPKDVEHFRAYTKDQCLLIGRKTYLEMQGWFKGKHFPIIITSKQNWKPDEGIAVSTIEAAKAVALNRNAAELICIGGGETFALAMPFATALVITHVHTEISPFDSPIYFPSWSENEWHRTHIEHFDKDDSHSYSFDIVRWEHSVSPAA